MMCDIFLAITGHFSLQHTKALMKGDVCVCIDNSVRINHSFCLKCECELGWSMAKMLEGEWSPCFISLILFFLSFALFRTYIVVIIDIYHVYYPSLLLYFPVRLPLRTPTWLPKPMGPKLYRCDH